MYLEDSRNRSRGNKLRGSTSQQRIKTGRYEHQPILERNCPFRINSFETELHAIIECPPYNGIC